MRDAMAPRMDGRYRSVPLASIPICIVFFGMPRVSPAAVLAAGDQAPSTADHILDVAGRLFFRRGFAATGVDLIVR
ncbi:MAG TPA: hypothetical protein VFN38_11415, partial [Gemmatimonadaceae bacterium]|nr:hypothetical protein [Gemmatimonadaceae bacterium]